MNILQKNVSKIAYTALLLVLFAAGLLLAQYGPFSSNPNGNKATTGYGSLGGDFSLDSAQGKVHLKDFRGQLVVMYFGFTSCPEVCPTALSSVAASMRNLEPEQAQQIQPLFISVDPARDTLENLAAYSAYFHPRMLGLTGPIEELDILVPKYGAYYRHIPLESSALGYTVDHTSRLYVIDQEGKLVTTIAHGTSVEDMTLLFKQYL